MRAGGTRGGQRGCCAPQHDWQHTGAHLLPCRYSMADAISCRAAAQGQGQQARGTGRGGAAHEAAAAPAPAGARLAGQPVPPAAAPLQWPARPACLGRARGGAPSAASRGQWHPPACHGCSTEGGQQSAGWGGSECDERWAVTPQHGSSNSGRGGRRAHAGAAAHLLHQPHLLLLQALRRGRLAPPLELVQSIAVQADVLRLRKGGARVGQAWGRERRDAAAATQRRRSPCARPMCSPCPHTDGPQGSTSTHRPQQLRGIIKRLHNVWMREVLAATRGGRGRVA